MDAAYNEPVPCDACRNPPTTIQPKDVPALEVLEVREEAIRNTPATETIYKLRCRTCGTEWNASSEDPAQGWSWWV